MNVKLSFCISHSTADTLHRVGLRSFRLEGVHMVPLIIIRHLRLHTVASKDMVNTMHSTYKLTLALKQSIMDHDGHVGCC